jgi:anti-sigma regulatory factor (Ser/Thr protein kinase)
MSATATHAGLFYADERQYATSVGGFLREGLELGQRSLLIATADRLDLVRDELGADAGRVTCLDEADVYSPQWNAYRVQLDFISRDPGTRARVVSEQRLADRVPAELLDYRRIEAAINLLFASTAVDVLCPYDTGALPADILEIGMDTHDAMLAADGVAASSWYEDPATLLAKLAEVTPPPATAVTIDCASPAAVAHARRLVHLHGRGAGLDPVALDNLTLAVSEILANALLHGRPPVRLHLYDAGPTWVCHVHDGGPGLRDPYSGMLPPTQPADHGYGLWLARQLCTAVDVGTDATGTHVRLHMRRG